MGDATQFAIGSEVLGSDGVCGELARVVVDPVGRELTHLVVDPKTLGGGDRLVPVEQVESAGAEVRLRCSVQEFEGLEQADETRFLAGAPGEWAYGAGQMLSWPYYGLGMGGSIGGAAAGVPVMAYDRIPLGEVEVHRGEAVFATDGAIGRVQGLVVDRADHHVTHVLLDEGHLWGKKTVAIPISAVSDIRDGVQLTLTKDAIRDLPPVEIDRDSPAP